MPVVLVGYPGGLSAGGRGFCSSLRSSASSCSSLRVEVWWWAAISASEYPNECGRAICWSVQSPVEERLSQFGVDADELGEPAFVDVSAERPFGAAVPAALPVGESCSERVAGVRGERDGGSGVVEAEFPAGLDEVGEEVFLVVGWDVEASALDDCCAERFDVAYVVKLETLVEHPAALCWAGSDSMVMCAA